MVTTPQMCIHLLLLFVLLVKKWRTQPRLLKSSFKYLMNLSIKTQGWIIWKADDKWTKRLACVILPSKWLKTKDGGEWFWHFQTWAQPLATGITMDCLQGFYVKDIVTCAITSSLMRLAFVAYTQRAWNHCFMTLVWRLFPHRLFLTWISLCSWCICPWRQKEMFLASVIFFCSEISCRLKEPWHNSRFFSKSWNIVSIE